MVPASSAPNAQLIQKSLTAYDYARELKFYHVADIIRNRMKFLPFKQRFFRVLQSNDVRRCDLFIQHLRNEHRQRVLAKDGLFFAAQLGSVRLLDYFLTRWKIDINTQQQINENFITTALLTAKQSFNNHLINNAHARKKNKMKND